MAPSASNSEPSGKGFVEREQPTAPARGDSAPRKLLQEVLQKTAAMNLSVGEPADPEVLREIARRYRDRPFELEPVLIELVHASLESQNKLLGAADADRHWSREIADLLFDDPAAHERLKLLWERLRTSS